MGSFEGKAIIPWRSWHSDGIDSSKLASCGSGFERITQLGKALKEGVGAKSEAADPDGAGKRNRDKQEPAECTELDVAEENAEFRLELEVLAVAGQSGVLAQDLADAERSLANPEQGDGFSFVAEKVLELPGLRGLNESGVVARKNSRDNFLRAGFSFATQEVQVHG
jgi:hypothetical protein